MVFNKDLGEFLSVHVFKSASWNTCLFYNDHINGKDAKARIAFIDEENTLKSIPAGPVTETNAYLVPTSVYKYGQKTLALAQSPLFNRYYLGEVILP